MAIQSQQAGVMPGAYPSPSKSLHNDAVSAINQLTYGELWGNAGTLVTVGQARLDLQGYTGAGQMNLQVQVNGVGAPSTMATALVADTVQAVPPPSTRSVPQQTEIVRVIKSALFDSLNDFENKNPHIWTVTGTPSS